MIEWKRVDSFRSNGSDPRTTVTRACPACLHTAFRQAVSFPDFQYFTDDAKLPKRIDIHDVVCDACHAAYRNPVLTDYGFQVLAAEAGCSYGASTGRAQEELDWLAQREVLSPGSCLLDVGCYNGDFLASLPQSMQRIGVDIDQAAIQRGIEKHGQNGIEFIFGDLNRFEMPRIPDVITMFMVLEHLPDPVATLTNLRAMSGAATRLVVEVPILENGLTNDVNGFFSALHMTHFSRQSLTNCLNRAGWEVQERFEQPDYNGCRVLATARTPTDRIVGAGELSSLDRYLAHWKSAVAIVSRRLDDLRDIGRVAIWGGGLHTEFLYHLTGLFRVPNRQFVIADSDSMKQGRSWRGIPIIPPARLSEIDWTTSKLVVSSYGGQAEIAKQAAILMVPPARIVLLYDHLSVH